MTDVLPTLRVYLDQDVDILLAKLLETHGFDCLTTHAAGHLGWSDEVQLEFAIHDTRVIITHNRIDFENLSVQWWNSGKSHGGIVLAMRRANTYSLARHALAILSRFDQQAWRNQVLYA